MELPEEEQREIMALYKKLYSDTTCVRSGKILLHTLTTKLLDISELQAGNYTLVDLVEISNVYPGRYHMISTLLHYYMPEAQITSNFDRIFPKQIETLNKAIELLKDSNITVPGKISIVFHLFDLYSCPDRYSAREMLDIMLKHRSKERFSNVLVTDMITIMAWVIGDCPKMTELHRLYGCWQPTTKFADIFASKNAWRKALIDELTKQATRRAKKHSSVPQHNVSQYISRTVHYLTGIENYILQMLTYPAMRDPLEWFFSTATIQQVKEALIHVGSFYINTDNSRVKSVASPHHASNFLGHVIPLFKIHIPHYFGCKADLHLLNVSVIEDYIEDQRVKPVEVRRIFTHDEIEKLLNNVVEKNDYRFMVIYTILREIGLRVGALVRLKLSDAFSSDWEPRSESSIVEKMKVTRKFVISDNLKEYLRLYLDDNPEFRDNIHGWLFPSKKSKDGHICTNVVQVKLKQDAKQLGIEGKHLHPHAFRHTIVSNLMANGNKLENVSKFIGHSSISITEKYYWTDTVSNIVPMMNIPWLSNNVRGLAYPEDIDQETTYDDTATVPGSDSGLNVEILMHVLLVYQSVLTTEQKQTIKERIPNIEQIFKMVCDASMSRSYASSSGTSCMAG